ncbi:aspartate kinase [Chryseosolibacter indicus]|uniref:Aspartokinase n=1 Tax=Chryseosolibacter indicus TaxID=2782351 RepID=A0ABS5VN42_9BACT|nr:aspartate kinase [Chryseosolibacter indicus]MBT1702786.1 aspartate kinase [Chryseosolibacter indicus]
MKVFKFGGASVKDAEGVKNVAAILHTYTQHPLIIVVSAMGKTTNALEKILSLYYANQNYLAEIDKLKKYHYDIMRELFLELHPVWKDIDDVFATLINELKKKRADDQQYDQVVSLGEVISTIIVHRYLLNQQLIAEWLDARNFIVTDSTYREGKIDWEATEEKMQQIPTILQRKKIILTQGFIGRSREGLTTTLGRDGSDFTAAIFASCLHAQSVTIWKDVPGVMNVDPKRVPDAAIVFDELPFKEAAEMTYYGASVIHPKTIKPLANKGIPLYVKNFDDPSLPGTKIHECKIDHLPPLIVFKDNQCLVSCKVTDYTFVSEDQMRSIFSTLSELNLRINVMQNSAISFSFCIDFRQDKIAALIKRLHEHFEVYYNTGLTLITVKNYDAKTFEKYHHMKGALMEQVSRSTLQVLVKL